MRILSYIMICKQQVLHKNYFAAFLMSCINLLRFSCQVVYKNNKVKSILVQCDGKLIFGP